MVDITKAQILKRLSDGTVMRNWGGVAALERQHLNLLLRDQFLQSYANHTFIQPMSNQFDLDEGGELRGEFRNLVLGPPQVSFEDATLLSADMTVRMGILSGDYVQHAYLAGSVPIVLRVHAINESMGYTVSAQIAAKLQQSESGQFTQLVLALSDAQPNTLECDLGTTPYASKQIGKAIFEHWLEQAANRQLYLLAEFDREDYSSTAPMGINILTQRAPWGARTEKAYKDKAPTEGDGALVMMMQLRSHLLPGTLPPKDHDFPYLIPGTSAEGAEYSCTLLLDPVNEGKPGEALTQVLRPVRMANAHHYTYRAEDKFTPADVVGFGQIMPTDGTYRLQPGTASVLAGKTQPFVLEGREPASLWESSNLKQSSAAGQVTQAGIYSSRDEGWFAEENQVSVVTAHYSDDNGEQSRSALVVESVRPVQVSPRVVTTSAQPVPITLSASSVDGGVLRWELVTAPQALRTSRGPARPSSSQKSDVSSAYKADLGKLEDLGNGQAKFTPNSIEPGKPEILFQLIRATDTKSNEFADAVVVIVTWPQQFSVNPFYVPYYKPGSTVPFKLSGNTPPGLTWHLFGEGEVGTDGIYTPPAAATLPVSVVMADYQDLQSGYAIIEHRPVVNAKPTSSTWDDLQKFEVELKSVGTCFANGMQQIEVKVTIETKINGSGIAPKISDAEFASLFLYNVDGGAPLKFLPTNEEGLEPVEVPEKDGDWAVSLDRNRVGTRAAIRQDGLRGEESTRTQTFFLVSTHLGTLDVAAEFKSDDNLPYRSTSYSNSKVTVTAEKSPVFSDDAYEFTRVPVKGWTGGVTEDFDNVDDTTCYWILTGKKDDGFQTLTFLRLKFEDSSRVSMIRWESNQRKERYCSFTSFAFTPYKRAPGNPGGSDYPEDPTKNLVHDGLLQMLAKSQTGRDGYLDTELVNEFKPAAGDVCFALQRVSNMPLFYDEEQDLTMRLRAELEEALLFRLMDQNGNWHKLRVSFHLPNGTPGSRNKLKLDRAPTVASGGK